MALIHFTKTPKTVAEILTNGFAYVAWPTNALEFVMPDIPKQEREPGQFGMVSFRYAPEGEFSQTHCQKYGNYGICVEETWAKDKGANPVIYVEANSIVAIAFKNLVAAAVRSVEQENLVYPEDGFRKMMYHNPAMAGVLGASEYANLIQIYRYMAPTANQSESEWRISNPSPNYSIAKESSTAIKAVSPPQGWANVCNLVKIDIKSIRYLVCPKGKTSGLHSCLPVQFQTLDIREIPQHRPWWRSLFPIA